MKQSIQQKNEELIASKQALEKLQRVTFSLLEDSSETNHKLQQAEKELKEFNETLKIKLEERTRELNEAHEKLLRTEKLAALGKLAGSLAHEIRNPLSVLTNATYFLTLCEPQMEDQTVKKHIHIINKEVERISQIVSNMLEFARPKASEKQPVDIPGLIRDVADRFPPFDVIRLVIEASPHLPPVMGDPLQLSQVFSNLMVNAYQAMPDGGELVVRTTEEKGSIQIVFEDTGCGILDENKEKIFESLFSTKPAGTGLGLSICRQQVEKHGGTLKVESSYGKGSKFIVKLPAINH
ncbi:MAG: ATP-binding protein [Deltaproteobacteria bacterium]|nr:ATP-binding protein [Deltaproteobacteria bacterium]